MTAERETSGEPLLIEILDEQTILKPDLERIRQVCGLILSDAGVNSGRVAAVLVDNGTIQQYNRDFLKHDFPTDVISFPLEERLEQGYLEGEILVSTETAKERAAEFQWTAEEEMLLYVVHGILHLTGYDDTTAEKRCIMRQKETEYLQQIGITVPDWSAGDWEEDEE
jgi:probable rRNA maturation factor